MPLDAQKMLLRVLDTAIFTRLGGNEALTVNVQIIAATNKDIVTTLAKKEFRADLYYRLKGMMFHIPPLRERPEDIAPLVEAFIGEFSAEHGNRVTGISPEALTHLEQAAWAGNIRQLRSTVQTAVAQERIQQYPSLREAAESLSIDTRTLQRYAQWKESDD